MTFDLKKPEASAFVTGQALVKPASSSWFPAFISFDTGLDAKLLLVNVFVGTRLDKCASLCYIHAIRNHVLV